MLRGRGRDPFLQHRLADEGVDERALAGIELADDDEEKELVELADRRASARLVGGRAPKRMSASRSEASSSRASVSWPSASADSRRRTTPTVHKIGARIRC